MKLTLFFRILILAIAIPTTVSCTPVYEKKQLPPANYQRIDIDGSKSAALEHMIINYDSHVDRIKKLITLDGEIKFNQTTVSGAWDVDEIEFHFYFINNDRYIVERKILRINTSGTFSDKVFKFNKIYQFKDDYKYIIYGYNVRVSG